tara:strand:- start:10 stop:297 length:288 start_codon:yes stop_codon:yes gene_type:complete
MAEFSPTEINLIDELWRQCSTDHVWAGWARPGSPDDEVWIFRKRANWRRFILVKTDSSFRLYDEKRRILVRASSLEVLMNKVDALPGLDDPLPLD